MISGEVTGVSQFLLQIGTSVLEGAEDGPWSLLQEAAPSSQPHRVWRPLTKRGHFFHIVGASGHWNLCRNEY